MCNGCHTRPSQRHACIDWLLLFCQLIGQFIHRATMRHSVTAVIRLFPVLRQLRTVKPEFDITLEVQHRFTFIVSSQLWGCCQLDVYHKRVCPLVKRLDIWSDVEELKPELIGILWCCWQCECHYSVTCKATRMQSVATVNTFVLPGDTWSAGTWSSKNRHRSLASVLSAMLACLLLFVFISTVSDVLKSSQRTFV